MNFSPWLSAEALPVISKEVTELKSGKTAKKKKRPLPPTNIMLFVNEEAIDRPAAY